MSRVGRMPLSGVVVLLELVAVHQHAYERLEVRRDCQDARPVVPGIDVDDAGLSPRTALTVS